MLVQSSNKFAILRASLNDQCTVGFSINDHQLMEKGYADYAPLISSSLLKKLLNWKMYSESQFKTDMKKKMVPIFLKAILEAYFSEG